MPFYNNTDNAYNFRVFCPLYTEPKYSFGIFAKGYGHAAANLANALLGQTHSFRDYEAYPVVFLYRHALELHLKNMIYQAVRLSAYRRVNEIDNRLYNIHELPPLMNTAGRLVELLFPMDAELKGVLEKIYTVVTEFSLIDPHSYSYRYPIKRDGTPSDATDQMINLLDLSLTMKGILDALETIDFGLDVETYIAEENVAVWRELDEILENIEL